MGAVAAWQDEDHTIVRQSLIGTWTWAECYAVCRRAGEMMTTVDWQVDVITDFTQSGGIPIGAAILHARKMMSGYPANWGVMLVVTTNRLILLLVSAFINTFPLGLGRRIFVAPTVNEAVRMIADMRAPSTSIWDDEDETQP